MSAETHTDTPSDRPMIAPDKVFHVGDPIPNALSANDLMQVLNLKAWVFFKQQRAGKFKRFEFKRPVSHKRYSGRLVAAYLEHSA